MQIPTDGPPAADNEPVQLHKDERGLVVAWLVKLVIGFVIAGVILFDAGSIIVNYVTLESTARDIAVAVTTEAAQANVVNQSTVTLAAKELAEESNVRLLDATLDQEGRVHIKIRRKADTLIVGRIGPLEDWTRATVEAEASLGN